MREEYTYAGAFVKSLEINMITFSEFEATIDYELGDFKNFLQKKGYIGESIEEMLQNKRRELFDLLFEVTEDENIKDVILAENDFHNIKAVIKAFMSKRDFENLIYTPTKINCDALLVGIKKGEFRELEEVYAGICKSALEICKKDGMQAMEIFLAKKEMEETIRKSEGFMHKFFEKKALFKDLKIYLRSSGVSGNFLKNALCENSLIDVSVIADTDKSKEEVLAMLGLKNEYEIYKNSPLKFEKYCDDELCRYLESAKTSFFEFDAVLGYFEGKKTEMKNIRIVANAKKSGMSADEVKERLRKTYV